MANYVLTLVGKVIAFGSETAAGAGAVPVTGSSIAGGDPGSHWQVSGGRLSPSAAGAAAGLSSGPYSLTFSNGSTCTVNIVANRTDVRTEAELVAAVSAAGSNKTVNVRADAKELTPTLTSQAKTGLTITGESGHSVKQFTLTSCSGITLDGVNFVIDNLAGADWVTSANAMLVMDACTCNVENCTFDGGAGEVPGAQQTTAALKKRYGGIYAINGCVATIDGNTFERVRDGIVFNNGTVTISNNHFQQIFEDAITGLLSQWTVTDNTATLFEGVNGKRFFGSISGTINPGDILTNGLGGASEQILRVVAVGSGYVDADYNNYAKPRANLLGTFTGPSGSITLASETTAYDGIHGDFFQPLLNGSVAPNTYQCVVLRNFLYRTNPYTFDAFAQEQNVQGVLAQANGGTGYHSPIDISYNVFCGGQPIGFTIIRGKDGRVAYNSLIWPQYIFGSDIQTSGCDNVIFEYNAGDNNTGGVIDDDGSHIGAGITIENNVFVDGNNGDQFSAYAFDAWTYPQTLAMFAPAVGGVIDVGNAGALTTTGTFREFVAP